VDGGTGEFDIVVPAVLISGVPLAGY